MVWEWEGIRLPGGGVVVWRRWVVRAGGQSTLLLDGILICWRHEMRKLSQGLDTRPAGGRWYQIALCPDWKSGFNNRRPERDI